MLRDLWEKTSFQLDRRQADPGCVAEEQGGLAHRRTPSWGLSFRPEPTPASVMDRTDKIPVAILREEGSNGDREMAAAFHAAGFEPWDVTMSDLLAGRIELERFRGLAAVGGFSYADVLDSAKGWAGTIRFNDDLRRQFDAFASRPDTFSLGVCNGCQLLALLGLVPWRGLADPVQPRFVRNASGRFESRFVTVEDRTLARGDARRHGRFDPGNLGPARRRASALPRPRGPRSGARRASRAGAVCR